MKVKIKIVPLFYDAHYQCILTPKRQRDTERESRIKCIYVREHDS